MNFNDIPETEAMATLVRVVAAAVGLTCSTCAWTLQSLSSFVKFHDGLLVTWVGQSRSMPTIPLL